MRPTWILGSTIIAASSLFPFATHAEEVKGLTVIVNFGDSPANPPASGECKGLATQFTEEQQKLLYKLINEPNYSDTKNTGSLYDYYLDNSNGNLRLSSDVISVQIPQTRCEFERQANITDVFGDSASYAGKYVFSLKGGPMFNIINSALCLMGERSIAKPSDFCSKTEIDPATNAVKYPNVKYSRVTETGVSSPLTTPYDFSGLTVSSTVYNSDWLDRSYFLGGSNSNYGHYLDPGVIKTYKFVQFIVPTFGSDDQAYGSNPGKGLWPRSLPHLLVHNDPSLLPANNKGLNGIPLGRTQLLPLDVNSPELGLMAHESGHTLFGFKDYYDTQKMEYKTQTNATSTSFPNEIDRLTNGYMTGQDVLTNAPTSTLKANSPRWFKSLGVVDLSLMGEEGDGNPPLVDAMHREKAGWESPTDLIDAPEGAEYTLDWHATGQDPRTARSFKYCRPNSNVNECFYMEARIAGDFQDNASRRPMYSKIRGNDVSGLLIWHAENYVNAFDFAVNQRKEGTAGLHFDVSVVEADGKKDFQTNWSGLPIPNFDSKKLFGNSDPMSTKFNDTNPPPYAKSTWWDGTPSGLSLTDIRVISDSTGKKVTFKIGKRPARPLFFDFDESKYAVTLVERDDGNGPIAVNVPLSSKVHTLLRPGKFKISVAPINNAPISYKVQSKLFNSSMATGKSIVTVTNNDFNVGIVKIVNSTTSPMIYKTYKFMMDQGVGISFFSPPLSNIISIEKKQEYILGGTQVLTNTNCYSNICEPISFYVTAEKGFKATGWEVQYTDGTFSRSQSTSDNKIRVDYSKLNMVKLIRARGTRDATNLCATNAVEPWYWDGEYNDIGILVRDNNNIYSSNVPRANFVQNREQFYVQKPSSVDSMSPIKRPEGSTSWTKVAICSGNIEAKASTTDCSLPSWSPYSAYAANQKVTYNGKVWITNRHYWDNVYKNGTMQGLPPLAPGSMLDNNNTTTPIIPISAGLIPPGVHTELWVNWTRPLEESFEGPDGWVTKAYPLGFSSMWPWGSKTAAPQMWLLVGSCSP